MVMMILEVLYFSHFAQIRSQCFQTGRDHLPNNHLAICLCASFIPRQVFYNRSPEGLNETEIVFTDYTETDATSRARKVT
jgi:hypothetical protein